MPYISPTTGCSARYEGRPAIQQGTADHAYDARRAWTTLAICCTALFMTTLDSTVLNTALPALQRGLHATTAGLQWAVDGYVVVRVSSLFLCGSIGDRYGRRRTFGIGLVLFVIGSLACGLAPNMAGLIAFRCFQGLGSAVLTPASLGIITNTFVDRKRRAMAVGVWSAATGLSMGVGPVLGGFLVENFGWRSVFLVNVPIGLFALAATRTLIESKSATPRPLDFPGQLSIGGSLFLATYADFGAARRLGLSGHGGNVCGGRGPVRRASWRSSPEPASRCCRCRS